MISVGPPLGVDPTGKMRLRISNKQTKPAAMMMEQTTLAASHILGLHGFLSKPYIDNFGGVELGTEDANKAYDTLLDELGLQLAPHKSCEPCTFMIWLGILINSMDMTLSIPEAKLHKVQSIVS